MVVTQVRKPFELTLKFYLRQQIMCLQGDRWLQQGFYGVSGTRESQMECGESTDLCPLDLRYLPKWKGPSGHLL